jgi:CheY-like chemotaxis protein
VLLTRQLLAFSRRQVLQPRPFDLNEVITDMDRMLRRVIPENILITTALTPAVWHALADRGQVEQVILNLAINARDAMPDGGSLTFETANVTLDEAFRKSHSFDVRTGPYVMLAVHDTGCGMSEGVKAHLFEPFYTTKPVGQGTGLGLATAFGIVKQSGGHIEVVSESGKGTTIRLYLPRCARATADAGGTKVSHLLRGQETILLVEDMDTVRELVREQLETLGYVVRSACNGEEALEESRRDGPIQLLLTDVVMPVMSGSELARRVRESHPSVKVLFMSGYPEPLEKMTPIGHYIQKPVSLDGLSRKIRAVLDGDKPAREVPLQ